MTGIKHDNNKRLFSSIYFTSVSSIYCFAYPKQCRLYRTHAQIIAQSRKGKFFYCSVCSAGFQCVCSALFSTKAEKYKEENEKTVLYSAQKQYKKSFTWCSGVSAFNIKFISLNRASIVGGVFIAINDFSVCFFFYLYFYFSPSFNTTVGSSTRLQGAEPLNLLPIQIQVIAVSVQQSNFQLHLIFISFYSTAKHFAFFSSMSSLLLARLVLWDPTLHDSTLFVALTRFFLSCSGNLFAGVWLFCICTLYSVKTTK